MFGALGTFSTPADAFDPAQIALVRSLADHAAAAIANTRLIAALDESRAELADRAEVERTLREINVRISAASDLSDVLQRAVDEAARLLHADGARIDLIDRRSGLLRWAYASGALKPDDDGLAGRPRRDARPGRVRPGASSRAGRSGPATTPTTRASRTARAPTATSR